MSAPKTVTAEYLMGISEGRDYLKRFGAEDAQAHLDNIERTIRSGFDASSPVGQMLRGERDFWRNQIKKGNLK